MKKNISSMLKCSMLVSLAIILGQISVFGMPFGGSINLSSVPIIVSSFLFGPFWGLFTGLSYGVSKILLGFRFPPVLDVASVVGVIVLDYIAPYSVFGLACVFKAKGKMPLKFAIIAVMVFRLLCTALSGILIWRNALMPELNIFVYSLAYNAVYILPETVLSLVMCPPILKFLNNDV